MRLYFTRTNDQKAIWCQKYLRQVSFSSWPKTIIDLVFSFLYFPPNFFRNDWYVAPKFSAYLYGPENSVFSVSDFFSLVTFVISATGFFPIFGQALVKQSDLFWSVVKNLNPSRGAVAQSVERPSKGPGSRCNSTDWRGFESLDWYVFLSLYTAA